MSSILFVGGPADGDRLAVPWTPYHGRTLEVAERARTMLSEVMAENAGKIEPVKRHVYRIVAFNVESMKRFVAVPDYQPDGYALATLLEGYRA